VAKARIICGTSDPFGKPFAGADVQIHARYGTLEGPRRLEAGLLEWVYTAPAKLGEPDLVTATWKQAGSNSKDELKVDLVQGPAVKLVLSAVEGVAHFGGRLAVEATAEDALGRPRGGATLALESPAGGSFDGLAESAPGQWRASWALPEDGDPGASGVRGHVFGPAGKEPAQLEAWLVEGTLVAGVADLAGLPVSGQRLQADGKEVETSADGTVPLGLVRVGKIELRSLTWPDLRRTLFVLEERTLWPQSTPLSAASQKVPVRLEPAIPVNVRQSVKGRSVTYWVEDPKGRVLVNREVVLHVTGGRAGPEVVKDGRHTVAIEPSGRSATVSVADRTTGVTALVEIRP
jgi:hypothetical protein